MPDAANAANDTIETMFVLRLTLPGYLMDHFEAQAIVANVSVEQFLLEHLTRTAYLGSDVAPIYLNDTERAEIQRLLGAKVSTPERLLEMIRRLVGWKCGPHKIDLRPNQLEQLAQIAKTLGQPLEKVAPQVLADAITEKLGTR